MAEVAADAGLHLWRQAREQVAGKWMRKAHLAQIDPSAQLLNQRPSLSAACVLMPCHCYCAALHMQAMSSLCLSWV